MKDIDIIIQYCRRRKRNALRLKLKVISSDELVKQSTMVYVYQDVISFIQYKKSGGLL